MKRLTAAVLAMALTAGCATKKMHLTFDSTPQGALILRAQDKTGPWTEFEARKKKLRQNRVAANYTPATVVEKMHKDELMWVKIQHEDYPDSEPIIVKPDPEDKRHQYRLIEWDFTNPPEKPPNMPVPPATDPSDIGRPGVEPTKGPKGAYVYVDSKPRNAQILVAESMTGTYRPWAAAEGEPRTPTRALVPINDTFWVKVTDGKKESAAQYVHVKSDITENLFFDLTSEKPEAAQTVMMTVTSNPPGGTVLISNDEYGAYRPFPIRGSSNRTPVELPVNVGDRFWIKVRLDRYQGSQPHLVVVEQDRPIEMHFELQKLSSDAGSGVPVFDVLAAMQLAQDDSGAGLLAGGYAPVVSDVGTARKAAILDALSNAVLQKFGGKVSSKSEAKNYVLMENLVTTETEGTFYSYDVVKEGHDGGLYTVDLRVKFRDDALTDVGGENLTWFVGGRERVFGELGDALSSLNARRAVSDALMDASMAVTRKDEDVRSAIDLAKLAADHNRVKYQTDLVLHLDAESELLDKLGQFNRVQTRIEWQVLKPVSSTDFDDDEHAQVVADGSTEASARGLRARNAARESLRDAAEKVADEVLRKVAQRYDKAAMHEVFVVGYVDQKDITHLKAELARIDGVREVQALYFSKGRTPDAEEDLHQFLLYLAPGARKRAADEVARVVDLPSSLDVVETDLYNTVAYVKVPTEVDPE